MSFFANRFPYENFICFRIRFTRCTQYFRYRL